MANGFSDEVIRVSGEDLRQLRDRIDAIDDEILRLLVQRASVVQQVGHVKQQSGAPVFRPEREVSILERLCAANRAQGGALPDASIAAIFIEIISGCRALEHVVRVAYLGPAGTYSEQAVRMLFGHRVEGLACASLDEALRMAETGLADIALLPVENSIEGTVGRTLDLLLATPLEICAEVSIPIHHCLLQKNGDKSQIRQVVAHAQALAQCQGWLDRNLPGITQLAVASNGHAAKMAAEDAGLAAIAGQTAATLYGLSSIAERIEDDPSNRTRFAALGRFSPGRCGVDQTSLILSVPDKAGAMLSLIEPLARHGVSMKRFESRPARNLGGGAWQYFFYIDLLGHKTDAAVALALAEIQKSAGMFKMLGSYPRFEKLSSVSGPTSGLPVEPPSLPLSN
ncbi:MAG: prephenate dehydratase [Burkholderiaceae bacterium]